MAYGALRLLYNNLISAHTMITASSRANGKVSTPVKDGSGVAIISVTGNFQGAFDLLYTLEIDSVAAGSEVGQATFRWRTSNTTAGAWEESGVLTRTSPAYALSADGLGTGLSVSHTGKTGVDFVVGDQWQWDARATYGRERLLDRNRMPTWRATGDTSETLTIDLGSIQQVTAFLLQDHNLTAAATVHLLGNSANAWGAPAYDSGALTVQDPLYLYLSQTYRYWRITLVDAANPDGYIEAANLFLGTYTSLTQVNAVWGSSQTDGYTLQNNSSEPGVFRRYAYAQQRKLALNFGEGVADGDITTLQGLQTALIDTTTHRVIPFWIHLFYDEADKLFLVDWEDIESWTHAYRSYLRHNNVSMALAEVVKV